VPELNRRYNKPRQTPYPIAEPATKLHLILLPKQAIESDVRTLKNDAFEAETEGNLEVAEQLWIRVLAVSQADQQAIKGIKRIAQASAVTQPLNQRPLPLNQPTLSRSIEQSSISSTIPVLASNTIPVLASNKRRKVRASAKGVEFAKSALKQKRLSQKALAEHYGLSPNTVSRFMKQELIDSEIFEIISNALNLKPEEITENTSAAPSISNSQRIKSSGTVSFSSDSQTIKFEVISVDERGQEVERCRRTSERRIEALDDGIVLEMVLIPEGTFLMGSPETEVGRLNNEDPQHSVTVKSCLMGKYPITQAQWTVIASFPKVHQDLELDPSHFKGTDRPVEQVSWHDAVEFCARLSKKTGYEYRLPTEAEWEYACRAGTITPFHFGETITPKLSNYDCNYRYRSSPKGTYRKQTSPVGYFPFANTFGLFDMHGNVWEWCLDHWHQNYDDAPTNGSAWLTDSKNNLRVLRGGSWYNDPRDCRSAFRYNWDSEDRLNRIGFRVVCPLP
jgi:formylglycine-generating enzyme required for sulfatase activity/DNA-binding Xre family transcriptional regulator